ncbi:class I adenylate-forming enzyme family protein [Tsukamurella pseudospumae]|uniref:Fatty acid--CoA ligase n=1 Tax=Tsukamurella pseudospumae TaxID=239498 RepID=A0A137Z709_9ACTN|nr:AMP-binding protein [Tsukamurella pseudospumae]KXO93967.1 hypothetical protein AXK61_05410 [Tsukamurella pseudospumae]
MADEQVLAAAESGVAEVIARWARDAPDRAFLLTDAGVLGYRAVDEGAREVAEALLAVGIDAGDRVAVAAPNCTEWILLWLATAKIGAVLVTLNVVYREQEFEYMLGQSGARLLVCAAEARGYDFVAMLAAMRDRIPGVEGIVFLADGDGAGDLAAVSGALSWPEFVAGGRGGRAGAPPASAVGAAPAVILYTSGTTGAPKGAVLTQGGILASAAGEAERFDLIGTDVILGHMPLNHVGGLTCTIAAAAVAGAAVALVPGFHPEQSLDAAASRRVTVLVGVPTMYTLMLGGIGDRDLSAVRLCVVGGANLEPALAQRMRQAFPGVRIANLYGASEASGACIVSAADDGPELIATSIGTPLAGVRVRVVGPDGAPVPPGADGELQVRGPSVAAGYWGMPEATAAAFGADGWLATGDVAVLSEDGHVALRGRLKEMYVRGGYNVYPAEVENFVGGLAGVAMVAVIGVPNAVYGETGRAFVVPARGAEIEPDVIREACRAAFAAYKVPDEVLVVDALPLTPAGKIRKAVLPTGEV